MSLFPEPAEPFNPYRWVARLRPSCTLAERLEAYGVLRANARKLDAVMLVCLDVAEYSLARDLKEAGPTAVRGKTWRSNGVRIEAYEEERG